MAATTLATTVLAKPISSLPRQAAKTAKPGSAEPKAALPAVLHASKTLTPDIGKVDSGTDPLILFFPQVLGTQSRTPAIGRSDFAGRRP
jgi:hypothetical protein